MPKASPLKRVGGRLVSAKSKTGNPECSAAMSAWVRGRKGGSVPASVFATLGKCRAQARQNKSAAAKQESGKLAAGRGTWQRSEKAKALLAQRTQRNAARSPQAFADRVHSAVASVPKSRHVGGLVWIHDAHAAYQKSHGPIPLDKFKSGLVKANQARKLDMSRADMPEGFKPADVSASSVKHMGAEWNFVRVPGKAATKPAQAPAPKKAAPAGGTKTIQDEVKRLHDTAHTSGTSFADIDALRGKLGSLPKSEVVRAAGAIGLVGMEKRTREAAADAIVSRIKSLKQSQIRVDISERKKPSPQAQPRPTDATTARMNRLRRAGASTPEQMGQTAYQRAKKAAEIKRDRATKAQVKATAGRHDEVLGKLSKMVDAKLKRATRKLAKTEKIVAANAEADRRFSARKGRLQRAGGGKTEPELAKTAIERAKAVAAARAKRDAARTKRKSVTK